MQNNKGNSIIEVMVVIVIITTGLVGTYGILNSGQRLATDSTNRIKAINLAREGLEAVENIRDTNWIKFSSDYINCWKVKDYDATCIGNPGKEFSAGSYNLYQSGSLWYLSGTITPSMVDYNTYRDQFAIYVDSGGLSATTGNNTVLCSQTHTTYCRSIYAREIKLSHPDANHFKIDSIVSWKDNGSKVSAPYTITLETILTNWKNNF